MYHELIVSVDSALSNLIVVPVAHGRSGSSLLPPEAGVCIYQCSRFYKISYKEKRRSNKIYRLQEIGQLSTFHLPHESRSRTPGLGPAPRFIDSS